MRGQLIDVLGNGIIVYLDPMKKKWVNRVTGNAWARCKRDCFKTNPNAYSNFFVVIG